MISNKKDNITIKIITISFLLSLNANTDSSEVIFVPIYESNLTTHASEEENEVFVVVDDVGR